MNKKNKQSLVHFAHANGISAAAYKPMLDILVGVDVLSIPKLGHNAKFPVDNNWKSLADELIDYLEKQAKRPVIGVGHSLGALVTFIAAQKRPDLFAAILLLEPPLVYGKLATIFKIAKRVGQIDRITPASKSKHRKVHWDNFPEAKRYFASKRFYNSFEKNCFDAFAKSAVVTTGHGLDLAFRADVEVSIFRTTPDNLSTYKTPLVMPGKIVIGRQSDASISRCIYPFAQRYQLDVQVIDGEHMFPLQQPDRTAALIQEFVNDSQ